MVSLYALSGLLIVVAVAFALCAIAEAPVDIVRNDPVDSTLEKYEKLGFKRSEAPNHGSYKPGPQVCPIPTGE